MARLYLFAEGQTEQTFADMVLKPHLANRGVYLHPPVLIAHARRKGRPHRGGGSNYLPMKNDIIRFLKQEKKSGDVYFTTMIDLYSIHREIPGLAESERYRDNPLERVNFLEQQFAADIQDARFLPYLQLHEFEAYLFADPTWFSYFYDNQEAAITTLIEIANSHSSPEFINDGPTTAPSKRIIANLPEYKYDKVIVGAGVGELIGLPAIRAKCPHFAAWLNRLEQLGGAQ